MDSESKTFEFEDNTKFESELIPKYEDHSNGTDVQDIKFNNKIVDKFMEQIHRRNSLLNQNKNLIQHLLILISRSSNKDYLPKLSYSEEANECTLRNLLDNIAVIEDEYHDASFKNLALRETLKEDIRQKKESLIELTALFTHLTEKMALNSVNSETGECFSMKAVKELLIQEEFISKTLEEYQLHAIGERHSLNLALEKKKNLAEGPIDFAKYEMMCVQTQNIKELIQPILEEIKSITKKISNIINILSHLGQKLSLAEKEKASNTEKQLQKQVNEARDHLFEEKKKYTKMKHESKELQHKFILLQYPTFIEDYNTTQQKNEEVQKEVQRLKTVFAVKNENV